MSKSTHFSGQPVFGQIINLLPKAKILETSRQMGGERYVKHFDAWHHLVIMLYAVIKRFDSLREITASMLPEVILETRQRRWKHQAQDANNNLC